MRSKKCKSCIFSVLQFSQSVHHFSMAFLAAPLKLQRIYPPLPIPSHTRSFYFSPSIRGNEDTTDRTRNPLDLRDSQPLGSLGFGRRLLPARLAPVTLHVRPGIVFLPPSNLYLPSSHGGWSGAAVSALLLLVPPVRGIERV